MCLMYFSLPVNNKKLINNCPTLPPGKNSLLVATEHA